MKIQNNINVSFKQRYVIVAENLYEASSYRDKIKRALNLVEANNCHSDIDPVSRKILITTDKDTDDFFNEIKKSCKPDALKKFLIGAVEFGKNQVEQLKTSLSVDTNYRMNSKKVSPYILIDYFSLVDKNYKIDHLERSNNVFFAVKDCDIYSEKLQEIEHSDMMTIGEYFIARKKLINTYLPSAKTLSSQNLDPMIKHIKNVLKYPQVTN